MYLKIILLFLIAPALTPAYSQQAAFEQDMSNAIRVFDANGKIFVNPDPGVDGSPYFINNWKYGTVTLNNSAMYSKRLIRLDFQRQEIHYFSDSNIEMTLPQGLVKEVVLADSAYYPVKQYRFQSGFPGIDNQDKNFFYLVLSDGKLKMLESIRKKIIAETNEMSGEIKKEYRSYEDFYFFSDGKMTRIEKHKAFILEFVKDKTREIEEFLKSHTISFKSGEDITTLIDYYNTLF